MLEMMAAGVDWEEATWKGVVVIWVKAARVGSTVPSMKPCGGVLCTHNMCA